MIARIWHGAVEANRSDEYLKYLERTGLPDTQNTAGNQGTYILRRVEGDQAHFLFVSLWESMDSIRKFAGSDVDRARYYPEDKEFLVELEPNVTHYEVAVRPKKM